MQESPDRVAVVGPGRVGTALALALPAARYRVTGVAGRRAEPLQAFVARVPSATPTLDLAEAVMGADLVLVCVPDDAVVDVLRGAARDDLVALGSRWLHVAGGHGLGPLRPVRLAGARVAACHPAQTIPDADRGLERLPGAAWAVTADAGDLAWAERLVGDLRGTPHRVAEGSRTAYHAALTLGSNATAAVVALARDLLHGAGISDPGPFLEPLATASVAGAAQHGAAALTGPVRRGDAGTVAAHLEELSVVMPEAVDAYRSLALLTVSYARRAGLEADRADQVLDTLRRATPTPDDA